MASKTEKITEQQYFTPIQLSILEKLKELGPLTRDQLCEEFGFKKHQVSVSIYPDKKHPLRKRRKTIEQYDKRTTIHDNIIKLQKRMLVEIFSNSNGKRGRPRVFYRLTEGK